MVPPPIGWEKSIDHLKLENQIYGEAASANYINAYIDNKKNFERSAKTLGSRVIHRRAEAGSDIVSMLEGHSAKYVNKNQTSQKRAISQSGQQRRYIPENKTFNDPYANP